MNKQEIRELLEENLLESTVQYIFDQAEVWEELSKSDEEAADRVAFHIAGMIELMARESAISTVQAEQILQSLIEWKN